MTVSEDLGEGAGRAIFPGGGDEGSQLATAGTGQSTGGGWPLDRAFWVLLGSLKAVSMLIWAPTPSPYSDFSCVHLFFPFFFLSLSSKILIFLPFTFKSKIIQELTFVPSVR